MECMLISTPSLYLCTFKLCMSYTVQKRAHIQTWWTSVHVTAQGGYTILDMSMPLLFALVCILFTVHVETLWFSLCGT